MDTSKGNVKICEKAKEIQSKRKFQDGDWVVLQDTTDKIPFIFSTHCKGCMWEIENLHPIWLPRQDQLQEMVFQGNDLVGQAIDLAKFRADNLDDNLVIFHSWEQWWLAFVMRKLYNKVWTGEQWKKI